MATDKKKSMVTPATELRRHAEEQLCAKPKKAPVHMSKYDTQRSAHELEVYQVELEMQNEELRSSQHELELSLKMFEDLYNYAPFGYFTFDTRGVIQKANHAGAQLFATESELLTDIPFTNFIADADDRIFFINHLKLVSERKTMLRCEIRLNGGNGTEICCQLQSVAVSIGKKTGYILSSVVDNTIRKYFEAKLKQAHDKLEETVTERTKELLSSNMQLKLEIEERKKAEDSLQSLYVEIKRLKDQLEAENIYLEQEVSRQYNFGEIIGQSNALARVFSQIEQVAPMNATVLLLGETGTGKGVVARAIHSSSARKSRPLITVNCATLPATLVESELFGRERGAFTGSDARQIGRFELADGGTIFLDEIGELPLELQSKLLRIIQDGEFERLGSPRTMKTDVRIIAATNRNLGEEIKSGKFREDLFYLLNVFPITMPPLRQRKDDIPLLVNHFVAKFNDKIGKKIDNVSKETLNTLHEYHWPGNVRELESVIERAVIISQGASLQVLDRFDTFSKKEALLGQDVKALVELEHDHILQVLQKVGWRIEGKNGAAGLLGLNASTLRARMRKYGIVRQ